MLAGGAIRYTRVSMWSTIKRPFFVLAPMADVTDYAFRALFVKYGKPDIIWTEFVSADGLIHPEGSKRVAKDLLYSEKERPIIAQLFTGTPEVMEKASYVIRDLGFDGLDINTGCPDRSVEKQKAGAYSMKDPSRTQALIRAAQMSGIEVSVKTRLGYSTFDTEWISAVLETQPKALTVHLRTRNELSKVPARWNLMDTIVALRNTISPNTLIIGNGDVLSMAQARTYIEQYKCDGIMIGRGIFGNPWFFSEHIPTPEEKIAVLKEHITLFNTYMHHKSFNTMKKHFKAYIHGFDGASTLRSKLMETNEAQEAHTLLDHAIIEKQ